MLFPNGGRRPILDAKGERTVPGRKMQLRQLVRDFPQRGLTFPRWFERIASTGIVSTDRNTVRRQRCANIACYVSALSGLSYITMTSFYDVYGLLPLNAYNALLVIVSVALPFWHRLGDNFVALSLVAVIGIGQLYVVWMLGLGSNLHAFFLLGGASSVFLRRRAQKAVCRGVRLLACLDGDRAQVRAAEWLASARRRPPARSDLATDADHCRHHLRGPDLLRSVARASRRRWPRA